MAVSRLIYVRKHDTWDGRLQHLNPWLSFSPTLRSLAESYKDTSALYATPWLPLMRFNRCNVTSKEMCATMDKFLKSYRRLCEKIEKNWGLEPGSIRKRVSLPDDATSSNLKRLFLYPFPITLKKIEPFCKEFGMTELFIHFNCDRFSSFGLVRDDYCKVLGATPMGPGDDFDEYYVVMERWYLLEMLTLLCDALEPQKAMGYFLIDCSVKSKCINLFGSKDLEQGSVVPVYTDEVYDGVDVLQCVCPEEYYSCRGVKKNERIADLNKQPAWASKEFLEACQRVRYSIIPEVQLVEQKFSCEDFVKKEVTILCHGRESIKLNVGLEVFKLNLDFTGSVGRLDMDCVGVGSRIGLDEDCIYRFMKECKFGIKNFEFFRPTLMFDQHCGNIQCTEVGEDSDYYNFSNFLCENLCVVVGDRGYNHVKMYKSVYAAYMLVSARSIFREGCRTMTYPILKIGPSEPVLKIQTSEGKRKALDDLTEAIPVKRANQLSEEEWKTVAEKTE